MKKNPVIEAPARISEEVILQYCKEHEMEVMDLCKIGIQCFAAVCNQYDLSPRQVFEDVSDDELKRYLVAHVCVVGQKVEEAILANRIDK